MTLFCVTWIGYQRYWFERKRQLIINRDSNVSFMKVYDATNMLDFCMFTSYLCLYFPLKQLFQTEKIQQYQYRIEINRKSFQTYINYPKPKIPYSHLFYIRPWLVTSAINMKYDKTNKLKEHKHIFHKGFNATKMLYFCMLNYWFCWYFCLSL